MADSRTRERTVETGCAGPGNPNCRFRTGDAAARTDAGARPRFHESAGRAARGRGGPGPRSDGRVPGVGCRGRPRSLARDGAVPRGARAREAATPRPVRLHADRVPLRPSRVGAGAIGYFVARGFDGSGLVALRYALLFGLLAICWKVNRARAGAIRRRGADGDAGAAARRRGLLAVRAQMYSFVLLAALLYLLEIDRRGDRRWIALWLALYVVWANLHGGFLVGAGLFFLHWLEQWLRGEPHRHLLLDGDRDGPARAAHALRRPLPDLPDPCADDRPLAHPRVGFAVVERKRGRDQRLRGCRCCCSPTAFASAGAPCAGCRSCSPPPPTR